MHANLMGTSGLQIHGYQCGLMAETLQHIPMRNGRFAGRSHAEAEIGHFGAPDRCLNGRFVLFKTALHERMIDFLYLMLGELPTHLGVRKVGLAHQHQAGSAYIKARNNAFTPGRAIGSDMHATITQRSQYRGTGPANRGMRRHAYRLIDYDDIIIFVDNSHISCDRLRPGLFLRQIKFDGLPRLQHAGPRNFTP